MRQVVLAAAGELRVEEGPTPEPDCGELRVRAQAVGICGSDLHAFADGHPFIDPLLTHTFALDDFEDALATMRAGEGIKVQVLPNG